MEQLRKALRDGTSQLCCFHDVKLENVVFEDNEDPVAAAREIFVSVIIIYTM